MVSRDDFEYRRMTIEEMICPECNAYVLVFDAEHRAEYHEQRYFGQLRTCPGSNKVIPGDKVRRRTRLAMVKNAKGRFINPVEDDYVRQMVKLDTIVEKIKHGIFHHNKSVEDVIDELKQDLDDLLKNDE